MFNCSFFRFACLLFFVIAFTALVQFPILNSSFEEYDDKGVLAFADTSQTIFITLLGFIITFIFFSRSTLRKLDKKIDENKEPYFSFLVDLMGNFIVTNSFHVFVLLLKLGVFKNTAIFITLSVISELLRTSLDNTAQLSTFKSKILLMILFSVCIISTGSTITLFVLRQDKHVYDFEPVVYDFFAPFLANVIVYLHKYISSKWKQIHGDKKRFCTFLFIDFMMSEAMSIAYYYVMYKITHFALISFVSALLGSIIAQISNKIILMHGQNVAKVERWLILSILPLIYLSVVISFFYEYYNTIWPKVADKNLKHFLLHGAKTIAISVALHNRSNFERVSTRFFQQDNKTIKWLSERVIYVFFDILYVYLLFLLIRGHGTYFLLRISGSLIGITVSNIVKATYEKKTETNYEVLHNLTENTQEQSSSEEEEVNRK